MEHHRIGRLSLRRPLLAGLAALLAALLAAAGPALAAPTQYSVINLVPEGGVAFLNGRGEAAVSSFVFNINRFFDGDRLYDIGTLGGGFTSVSALNNNGVVAGFSGAGGPFSEICGFRWTVADGIRAIPGSRDALVYDINDNNQAVGELRSPILLERAARFDPDGRVFVLGPPVRSIAAVINNAALAGGVTIPGDETVHATLWGGGSRFIDLGTLGGDAAGIQRINERSDAAGLTRIASDGYSRGFVWNARDGVVWTGAQGILTGLVAALNDRGEVAGNADVSGERVPISGRAHAA